MWYKLSNLFDLQMGKTPSRNNPNYWNSKDYLWVSISDMSGYDKYVSSTKEYISERAVKESGIKTIPANTVIMSFKLSIGKTAITTESIFSNEAIMAFIDKKTTAIDPEYIFYLFSGKDWDEGSNKAVMGKTLNKATLSNTEVDIPSLDIQKERVDKLNKISTLIADKKQQLNQLDELVKARFVEMFGGIDRYISIKDSGLFIADGNYSSKYPRSSEFTSFGVPFIRANNIKDNTVVDDDMYFISPEKHDELKKGHLLHGDILVTTRGNIGQLGIVPQKHNNSNINAQIVLLRCRDTKYLPEYLLFALQTVDVKKQFIRQQTGTALKQLPVKHLEKISFIDAPVELQNQFATFVTQVDKSKFALRKSIISLMNLWYNINQYVCERTYGEA